MRALFSRPFAKIFLLAWFSLTAAAVAAAMFGNPEVVIPGVDRKMVQSVLIILMGKSGFGTLQTLDKPRTYKEIGALAKRDAVVFVSQPQQSYAFSFQLTDTPAGVKVTAERLELSSGRIFGDLSRPTKKNLQSLLELLKKAVAEVQDDLPKRQEGNR